MIFFGNILKGIDAVKLPKSDLKQELTMLQIGRIYNSQHPFDKT